MRRLVVPPLRIPSRQVTTIFLLRSRMLPTKPAHRACPLALMGRPPCTPRTCSVLTTVGSRERFMMASGNIQRAVAFYWDPVFQALVDKGDSEAAETIDSRFVRLYMQEVFDYLEPWMSDPAGNNNCGLQSKVKSFSGHFPLGESARFDRTWRLYRQISARKALGVCAGPQGNLGPQLRRMCACHHFAVVIQRVFISCRTHGDSEQCVHHRQVHRFGRQIRRQQVHS